MFDFATQGKSTITGFPFLMRIRYLQDTYVDRFVIFEYICLKLYYKWWLCTALVNYIKPRCVIRFVVCQNLAKKGIILTKTRRSQGVPAQQRLTTQQRILTLHEWFVQGSCIAGGSWLGVNGSTKVHKQDLTKSSL